MTELLAAYLELRQSQKKLADTLRSRCVPGTVIDWKQFGETRRGTIIRRLSGFRLEIEDWTNRQRRTISAWCIVAEPEGSSIIEYVKRLELNDADQ